MTEESTRRRDSRPFPRRHPLVTAFLGLLGLLVAFVGIVAFTPLLDGDLKAQPAPAADYAAAQDKAKELLAQDGADVNPLCRSQILDHGQREAKSVVLLHGYTNCPKQMELMAKAYYDAGYNVVIARIPAHGMADRLTTEPSDLSPEDLARATDRAVDVAAGLGEKVTVLGLSGGGTMAAWAAAQRDDVSEAVLLAPLLVPKVLPNFLAAPVARLSSLLPDYYLWWDGSLKEKLASPPYAYPRYSIKSLGALLALGRFASSEVNRKGSLDRLVVVLNENDGAVSNSAITAIADELVRKAKTNQIYTFPKAAGFKHDLVDPNGENAKDIAAIYDVLGPVIGLPSLATTLPAKS